MPGFWNSTLGFHRAKSNVCHCVTHQRCMDGSPSETILSVCPDKQLSRRRERVLQRAGLLVISVHTEVAARYEITLGRCGVLLLCHLLTWEARNDLARLFHESCPQPPHIVCVLAEQHHPCPEHATATVLHSCDAAALVNAVKPRRAA